jgi:Uri superfamily endonuclease
MNHITFLGEPCQTGTYVLWLTARQDCAVAFGRLAGGRPLAVPAGHYAYVGSAMGRGGVSPASRLLRHATRSAGKPPHAIRAALVDSLVAARLTLPRGFPPQAKRLRWHVDYLLDEPTVEIAHVTLIRATTRLESVVAHRLAALPEAGPLWPGLGAGDAPGETHLLRLPIEADEIYPYITVVVHDIIHAYVQNH